MTTVDWIPLYRDGLLVGWIDPHTARDLMGRIEVVDILESPLTMEIKAFEEWRDRPDSDEARILDYLLLEKIADEITKLY